MYYSGTKLQMLLLFLNPGTCGLILCKSNIFNVFLEKLVLDKNVLNYLIYLSVFEKKLLFL